MSKGSNLPSFRETQLAFAAHIRNPELHPRPADVEERRMKIYRDLFFNNIEGFLDGAFPVAKKMLEPQRWSALVRDFVHRHASESPYFLQISQEFLVYLDQDTPPPLPDFYLELCHYEWTELALRVDERDIPEEGIDPQGDLLDGVPVCSPVIWPLSYRYPVHRISPEYQPEAPPEAPTFLVVYRNRKDRVRFLESNRLTHRLLELLDGHTTGAQALDKIAQELGENAPANLRELGAAALERLRQRSIIAGSAA